MVCNWYAIGMQLVCNWTHAKIKIVLTLPKWSTIKVSPARMVNVNTYPNGDGTRFRIFPNTWRRISTHIDKSCTQCIILAQN